MNIRDKKFFITGASGQLGKAFQDVLSRQGIEFVAPSEDESDITDVPRMKDLVGRIQPDVVINCAAYNAVDNAEEDAESAYTVNSQAVENLALICKEENIFFVQYSSDYVFDGQKKSPYIEDDEPHPLNVYGKSKLEGEKRIKAVGGDYLIFRLSWVYGEGRQNFLYKLNQWAKERKELEIADDEISVPTSTEDIAEVTLKALGAGLSGLYHLVNSGQASRYEWARYYFEQAGISRQIRPVSYRKFAMKAERPGFSVMSNRKLRAALAIEIPNWQQAIQRFIDNENI